MNKDGKKYRTFRLSAILMCASLITPVLVNAQDAAARQKMISQVQRAIDIIREKHVDQGNRHHNRQSRRAGFEVKLFGGCTHEVSTGRACDIPEPASTRLRK